jgi:hypothetical protein
MASPYLASGLMTALGLTFYFFWNAQFGFGGYDHFLYYPVIFAVLDFSLVRKLRYEQVDAFVLSGLAVILVSQIWELPVNAGAMRNLIGPAAPWQWMALPLLWYFLRKTGRLGFTSGLFLAESLGLTVFAYLFYGLYPWPDYLIVVWTAFFLALFSSSSPSARPSIRVLASDAGGTSPRPPLL